MHYEQIAKLGLRRLTIDLDGTVIRAGSKVAWEARGSSPHHRRNSSYYPLLGHYAQTGQILRIKNRPDNVHDSKATKAFARQLIAELRERFGRSLTLELRMDGPFLSKSPQVRPFGLLLRGQSPAVKWNRGQSAGRRPVALECGSRRYRCFETAGEKSAPAPSGPLRTGKGVCFGAKQLLLRKVTHKGPPCRRARPGRVVSDDAAGHQIG